MRSLDSEWVAPALWESEFRNVLRKFILSGRITLDDALAFMTYPQIYPNINGIR